MPLQCGTDSLVHTFWSQIYKSAFYTIQCKSMLLAVCPVNCCLSMPAGVDHMQRLLWGHYTQSVLTIDDMCATVLQPLHECVNFLLQEICMIDARHVIFLSYSWHISDHLKFLDFLQISCWQVVYYRATFQIHGIPNLLQTTHHVSYIQYRCIRMWYLIHQISGI